MILRRDVPDANRTLSETVDDSRSYSCVLIVHVRAYSGGFWDLVVPQALKRTFHFKTISPDLMRTTLGIAGSVVFVSIALLLVPAAPVTFSRPDVRTRVHENRLRTMAITHVQPTCPATMPADELPAVGVAYVYLTLDGRVAAVEPVEAPTPGAAESLSAALIQWRFRVVPEDVADRRFRYGRLTFYYTRDSKGDCMVLNPSEAPSYRDWPGSVTPGWR